MKKIQTYFKILSNKGWSPLGKQKVYKNNEEVKDQMQDPVIYFAFALATDEEPEELWARVSHEWHNHGDNVLKVKELQTFESETILCLFNVFISTPKKMVLNEFCDILSKAQGMTQEYEPIDFVFDSNDLPPNLSLPATPPSSTKAPRSRRIALQQDELEGTGKQEGISCKMQQLLRKGH